MHDVMLSSESLQIHIPIIGDYTRSCKCYHCFACLHGAGSRGLDESRDLS